MRENGTLGYPTSDMERNEDIFSYGDKTRRRVSNQSRVNGQIDDRKSPLCNAPSIQASAALYYRKGIQKDRPVGFIEGKTEFTKR